MRKPGINGIKTMRLPHHFAKTVRCGLALLLLAPLLCRAETTNLMAVADTSLHSFFPDGNFGGGTSFTSGGRNMGGHARALLRFDIAAHLPAGVGLYVQIRLFVVIMVTSPARLSVTLS
jgi:hypothetical protein